MSTDSREQNVPSPNLVQREREILAPSCGAEPLATGPQERLSVAPQWSSGFRELYDAHFSFVWRCAANRGVPQAALDDVVQEVFIVVHRKLDEFEARSSVRTWLSGIVRRVVADYVRKRGNQPAGHEPLERVAHASTDASDAELERKAAVALLDSLLERMTPEQREVFMLHELEHLSGIEIAELLGIRENTVWSRLRTARKIFQEGVARHAARSAREQR